MKTSERRKARARPGLSAGGIALTYLIISVVWILTSDILLSGLFPSFSGFFLGEVLKGILFISATALVLFILIRRGHLKIQDIERRARDELRFQEDVLSQVSDAVAFAGLDGRVLYANSSALRLYGVEPGQTSEILGRPFAEVVDFQWTRPGDAERCRDAFENEGRWRGEIILTTRYGKRFVLDCDITRVRDDSGRITGALAIARDVSEYRRAERELRRSEERLALHMQLVPLAAIEWDENMIVGRWNDAAVRVFGYTRDEMIGDSWEVIVPESDRPKVGEVIHRLLEKGEPVQVINRNLRKDGTEIVCEWFNTPLIGEEGRPIGVASLAADITQRRLDQQKLQESLRVQRLLLSELDHRVKNALSGLITMVDLTRSKAVTIDEFASAVRRRVEAMARVHAMLSQSRWTSLDLREIIEAMRPPEAPGHINLDGPDVRIPVRQATPLGMTVQELMSNSLKHGALSAAGGALAIRWGTDAHSDGQARRALWIDWRESGGPSVDTSPDPGLGTSLIEGFCRFELGGDVELGYSPDGVRHTIRIVLDDTTREEDPVGGLHSALSRSETPAPASDA